MGTKGIIGLLVASVLINAAWALWNPAWLVVSLFSLVKCLQNSMSVS